MEETEKLYRDLKEIETKLEKAERRKIEALNDSGTLMFINGLIAAERILDPNDRELGRLRSELEKVKKDLNAELRELKAKEQIIRSELNKITSVEIQNGIDSLNRELLPLKLERKVIGRKPSGFDMRNRLEVETNEGGIVEVRKLITEGREVLDGMRFEPIAKIKKFTDDQFKKIRSVNLIPRRVIEDEFQYVSREFAEAPVSHVKQ